MIHGEANSGAAAAKNEGEIKSTSGLFILNPCIQKYFFYKTASINE